MAELNYCPMPSAILPMSSDEPIAEWDIVSDSIFFSQGALKCLNLTNPPRKMADFYRMLPPEGAEELAQARKSVLAGKTGSTLNSSYLCNGLWIKERMIVIARNSAGHATRAMGVFESRPLLKTDLGFHLDTGHLSDVGMWIYQVPDHIIWRDRACAEILGLPKGGASIVDGEAGIADLHPADKETMRKHYELFCSGKFLGDHITDIVRARNGNGEYIPIIVKAWAVERDKDGRAILVSGVLSAGSTLTPGMDESLLGALNNMGTGQWNWDTASEHIHLGDRFLEILGYPPEKAEEIGKNWRSYVHPDDLKKVEDAREMAVASRDQGDAYECTYRMKRADGGWAWIFDRGCVTWRDVAGRGAHMIGSITNITTAQAERDKLEELVRHDTLTGLRSRAFFNLEMEHIEQNAIRPVSVISVDITGLKMVNDNLGHARGDELLTKAASLLHKTLRQSDCIARVGGDEFMVLLPACDYETGAKLLKKIEKCFDDYNDNPDIMPVLAAFGLASADSADTPLQDVIARADEEMYKNKKADRPKAHARLTGWIKELTGKDLVADERLN